MLAANAADVVDSGLPGELLDRLTLAPRHLEVLAKLCAEVRAELPRVTASVGQRIAKPLGIVLMIYEARPTVTIEGALLPVAVGNAVILRGGKEMAQTNAELGRHRGRGGSQGRAAGRDRAGRRRSRPAGGAGVAEAARRHRRA